MGRLFKLTGSETLTIYRKSLGEYDDDTGLWVEGDVTEVIVEANIQPIRYWEVMQMPESDRTKKWCRVFTDLEHPLRTKKEGENGWDADEFVWQDDRYEIRRVQRSTGKVLPHTESWAVRLELTLSEEE